MRVLMTMLIFAGVFCMLSAITGVQSFHYDSRTGSVITHHQGYGRMYAVASCSILCCCILRYLPQIPACLEARLGSFGRRRGEFLD
jgi:hypothetical protein